MTSTVSTQARAKWEPAPACRRCPRLVAARRASRVRFPEHFNAPVPSRYGEAARLLIIGLAPGARGANRTGLAFHGDSSSKTLFAALARAGLAGSEDSSIVPEGLGITNVVRCLPPGNAPTRVEVATCSRFLKREIRAFLAEAQSPRVLLCLGGLAHRAVEQTLNLPSVQFGHGVSRALGSGHMLMSSYHPSAQNVNTNRLTPAMLDELMALVVSHLGDDAS